MPISALFVDNTIGGRIFGIFHRRSRRIFCRTFRRVLCRIIQGIGVLSRPISGVDLSESRQELYTKQRRVSVGMEGLFVHLPEQHPSFAIRRHLCTYEPITTLDPLPSPLPSLSPCACFPKIQRKDCRMLAQTSTTGNKIQIASAKDKSQFV